jgi:hypothetical protein
MKSLFIAILMIFVSVNYLSDKPVEYIIINAFGPGVGDIRYVKPILISKAKYTGAIKESDTLLIRYITKKKLTAAQIDLEMTCKYERLIADNQTFQSLSTFIINNKSYYTTPAKSRRIGHSGYELILNGKIYYLDYDNEKNYFEKLKNDVSFGEKIVKLLKQ